MIHMVIGAAVLGPSVMGRVVGRLCGPVGRSREPGLRPVTLSVLPALPLTPQDRMAEGAGAGLSYTPACEAPVAGYP